MTIDPGPEIVDLTAEGTRPKQKAKGAKKRRRTGGSEDLTVVDVRPAKLFKDACTISSVTTTTTWHSGTTQNVSWSSSGSIEKVDLAICEAGSCFSKEWLVIDVINTGQYNVVVPKGLKPGATL